MKIKYAYSVIILILLANITRTQFGGGSGTWFDPYCIATPNHLNNIKNYEVDDEDTTWLYLDDAFILVSDINLGVAPWDEDEGWEPIGTPSHPFSGYFNGNDHIIANLTINRGTQEYIGLFGVVSHADFYDINLVNVSIDGGNYVGALAGLFHQHSAMNEFDENSTETSCSGNVWGNHHTGGLIGHSDSSLIRLSSSTCNLDGFDYVGGLAGSINVTSVSRCFTSSGIIIGNSDYVGGFAGWCYESSILRCFSESMDVRMTGLGSITGGMVGYLAAGSLLSNSYCTGSADGISHIGGLTGYNHDSEINNCYSLCEVTGSGPYLGGLVGRSDGSITNSYWDTDVSGVPGPGLGDGRTTDEMTYAYAENTFVDWDFENTWVQDPDIGFGQWNNGYPYLEWEHNPQQYGFAGGSGTEEDPYLIGHPNHLNSVRGHLSAHFRQIADIDLGEAPWNEGDGWEPIGDFGGNYFGDDYTISNLTIHNSVADLFYLGLFEIASNATIRNIRLTEIEIFGGSTWETTGGLVGYVENTLISDCYVNGTLAGGSLVGTTFYGGLAGYCHDSTVILRCEADVDITTPYFAGGLTGRLSNSFISRSCSKGEIEAISDYAGGLAAYAHDGSVITTSFSEGSVNGGNNYIGGLVGILSVSSIDQCYSTAQVEGNANVGGAAGYAYNGSEVSNSYSTGIVTGGGAGYEGGFIGYFTSGNVWNCFSTGLVNTVAPGRGFIGVGGGTVVNCFWDKQTSGQEASFGGGTGKSTAEMKRLTTFTDVTTPGLSDAWDFVGNPIDDTNSEDLWDFDGALNYGYPFIAWQKPRLEWNGSESADPLLAGNWSSGSLPEPSDNVLVPSTSVHNLVIGSFPASPLIYNSLFIEPGKTVIIDPGRAMTLTGYIHNEGILAIESDVTGTGSLIGSGSAAMYGNAAVSQYLISERWHLVSPPVSDAVIEPYLDIYLKEFNEPDNSWTYLVNPLTIPLNPTQGYSAWASDDLTGTTEVLFTGSLNSGDYPISGLSYTPGSGAMGWNLIGNPYPSSLQWNDLWTKAGISEWACVHYDGNDACFNAATGTEWPSPGDMPDGIIPPTQGFWIRATSPDASLTIPQSQRIHGTHALYKNYSETVCAAIRLKVDGNLGSDVFLLQFIPESSVGYNPLFDLEKRWGYSSFPQIYSIGDSGILYSVKALPEYWEGMSVPLGFEVGSSEFCTLTITEFFGFDPALKIGIRDNKENVITGIGDIETYNFYADPAENGPRFDIIFYKEDMGIKTYPENFSFFINYGGLIVESSPATTGTLFVYDLTGTCIAGNIPIKGQRTGVNLNLTVGACLIVIHTGQQTITRKIINK